MKKKINCTLIIDDDAISNFVSEKVIERLNITNEIKVAQNGDIALKYIEDCSSFNNPFPELIFLDINMPVMNAFDFLDLYRKFNVKNEGSIIILTSSDNPKDIEHLLQFKITDYVNKPLTSEKVTALMEKYYGW